MSGKIQCYMKAVPDLIRKFGKHYDAASLGELGSGAGKGGGAGGPIREAGGPFGKIGAAREEEYFYNLRQKLLLVLKGKLQEENFLREKEIERHEAAICDNNRLSEEIDEKLDRSSKGRGCDDLSQ